MKGFIKYSVYIAAITFIMASCNNEDGKAGGNENDTNAASSNVARISYSIINTYPHDTSSFTQGLVVYKGLMYEGTGGSDESPEGKNSHLYQIDIKTGKALQTVKLPGQYFGEGITVLNDTIYQLTWQNKKVFVYTLPNLKKVKELSFNTDGWGITHNGKELIVSDGTSNLYFYEPSTFRLLRSQSVTNDGALLGNINELEYIDGFVYANEWGSSYIYKIDPNSGQIRGILDFSQLVGRLGLTGDSNSVLNGIAYDADTKKVYITGKKWPELYEIELGH